MSELTRNQMKQIHEAVEKKAPGSSFIKPYLDVPHGWMAARGEVSFLNTYCWPN
jgi:hypothetical protein